MVTNWHKILYQNEINLLHRSFSLPWKLMKGEQNFNLPTNAFDKGTNAQSFGLLLKPENLLSMKRIQAER